MDSKDDNWSTFWFFLVVGILLVLFGLIGQEKAGVWIGIFFFLAALLQFNSARKCSPERATSLKKNVRRISLLVGGVIVIYVASQIPVAGIPLLNFLLIPIAVFFLLLSWSFLRNRSLEQFQEDTDYRLVTIIFSIPLLVGLIVFVYVFITTRNSRFEICKSEASKEDARNFETECLLQGQSGPYCSLPIEIKMRLDQDYESNRKNCEDKYALGNYLLNPF